MNRYDKDLIPGLRIKLLAVIVAFCAMTALFGIQTVRVTIAERAARTCAP